MAIALVASTSAAAASTTTSPDIDTTGATLLIAVVGDTSTPTGPTDSKSNEWARLKVQDLGNSSDLGIFVAFDPIVGTGHNFTTEVNFPSMCIAAFSGVEGVYLTDITQNGSASTTSLQAGSLTPPRDNSLVIAALSYRSAGAATADGGFTTAENEVFQSGVAVGSGLAYLIQTTAAAANPAWSWSGAASAEAITLAFAAPPTGGGGGGETSHVFVG